MNEAATALLHPSFHPSHPLLLLSCWNGGTVSSVNHYCIAGRPTQTSASVINPDLPLTDSTKSYCVTDFGSW